MSVTVLHDGHWRHCSCVKRLRHLIELAAADGSNRVRADLIEAVLNGKPIVRNGEPL